VFRVGLVDLDRERVPALTVTRLLPGDTALEVVRELREGLELEGGEAAAGIIAAEQDRAARRRKGEASEIPGSGSASPTTTIPRSTVPDASRPSTRYMPVTSPQAPSRTSKESVP
jgi:hypothetical protein